jgi:nucleoside-diphosphate-sugar epimerase
MARVLITGASGFIGSNLARACLQRGDEVSAVVRPRSSVARLAGIGSRIGLYRLDLADARALGNCLAKTRPEIVFHAGARTRFENRPDLQDLAASVEENVTPLVALLSALATCDCPPRSFVRTGTIAEYGDCATPYTETARERPTGSYAASLLAGTHYLEMAQPRLPFLAVTARLALTYGPGQSESFLIPRAISQLLSGQKVSVRSPLDRRDLIHVDDVTRALMMLGDTPEDAGPVVNVGTGHAPTVAEVMQTLIKLTGAGAGLVNFGDQTGDPVELIVSAERIRDRLGWSPEIQLQDGLERTVKWARENIIPEFAAEMQA